MGQPTDRLVLVGFGAGLTWAAAALEWGVPLPVVPVSWWKRLLRSLRYAWARARSLARRVLRRLAALLLGQVHVNGWRSGLRRWVDGMRKREAKIPPQDE